MKNVVKGGLLYLLSFLCTPDLCQGQGNAFLKYVDPQAKEFGKVLSPSLPDSIADLLLTRKLSFPEWASFYRITVAEQSRSTLGDYRLEEERIAFTPRFLPDPSIRYQVTFNFNALYEVLALAERLPQDSLFSDWINYPAYEDSPGEITGIYPSISVLPENALRMYLYFSTPMGFDNPFDHIALLDQEGMPIKNAFVELPEGLWNEDRTRLTLLFHPGRVKQGVGPNVSEGPVLVEGKLFEVQVSSEWTDGTGYTLASDFTKRFFVTRAQRSKLRKKDWVLESICKDECILRLSTGGIPDLEMVDNMVTIQDKDGESIDFVLYGEASGTFLIRSDSFQKDISLKMIVNPRMEDISGNTFLNAFDAKEGSRVDQGKPIEIPIKMK